MLLGVKTSLAIKAPYAEATSFCRLKNKPCHLKIPKNLVSTFGSKIFYKQLYKDVIAF